MVTQKSDMSDFCVTIYFPIFNLPKSRNKWKNEIDGIPPNGALKVDYLYNSYAVLLYHLLINKSGSISH